MKKILLLTRDSHTNGWWTTMALEERYNPLSSANWKIGLHIFDWHKPDMAILDWGLKDGRILCRELRQVSTVPIIGLAGPDATTEVVCQALGAGCDRVIRLPVSERELVAVVEALWDSVARADSRHD